ncbi:hypothetical protein C2G38_2228797 [Gigaspora rosea]|uniref:CCHC-type domain-containing protein n=1 Tax=Gigaspora rosea TaxID=44941 RepID=A0A397TZ62_9GLOM|nr:hypothetical protein C2G38_2228797 [Gigaspora rosea]
MDAAIDIVYCDAYPLHCIYHISQNLIRNLKALLGSAYNAFARDFFLFQNNLSPARFNTQWLKLIATYPNAANYLNSELYPSKERWAKAYTTKFFTAGISSSHVESENSARYVNHNEWYHANSSAQLSGASAECFPNIDLMESNELPAYEPSKEEYDMQQIHLNSLLADLFSNEIIKIYRHFWHIFASDNKAFFYITLIPKCWYKNENMQDLDLDEQPYIMNNVRRVVQKRRDYGETFNLARKIVRQKLTKVNDNDKENFDPSQVEDPIEQQHRGRPSVKRLKSSFEQPKSKKSTTQNKCAKCGVAGHYAPTCKN